MCMVTRGACQAQGVFVVRERVAFARLRLLDDLPDDVALGLVVRCQLQVPNALFHPLQKVNYV